MIASRICTPCGSSPARGLHRCCLGPLRRVSPPDSANHTLFSFQRSLEVLGACRELQPDCLCEHEPKTQSRVGPAPHGERRRFRSMAWDSPASDPRSGRRNLRDAACTRKGNSCLLSVFLRPLRGKSMPRGARQGRERPNALLRRPRLARSAAFQPGPRAHPARPGSSGRSRGPDRSTRRPAARAGALRSCSRRAPPRPGARRP